MDATYETIAVYATEDLADAAAEDLAGSGHDARVHRIDDATFIVRVPSDQATDAEDRIAERVQHSVSTHA